MTETCPTCGIRAFDDPEKFMAYLLDDDDYVDGMSHYGTETCTSCGFLKAFEEEAEEYIVLLDKDDNTVRDWISRLNQRAACHDIDIIHVRLHRLVEALGTTMSEISAVHEDLVTLAKFMRATDDAGHRRALAKEAKE